MPYVRAALRDLGYIEGQNMVLEYRGAEGHADRLPGLARQLVEAGVDVLYVMTAPAALAAKQATNTVPIVFSGIPNDPVAIGLVASLSRPGANVTGASFEATSEQAAKQLELLKELAPTASRVGVIRDPEARQVMQSYKSSTDRALAALGLDIVVADARRIADLDTAFEKLMRGRVQALWLASAPAVFQGLGRIAEFALKNHLPAVAGYRQFVDAGGLVSFGASWVENHRRGAAYVDKILKGTKPADLPVEQPTKFELVINLKTAKALGLTIPASLLLRADQVIE
jgi:putative ABC transport system substrate-binding protein